MPQETFLGSQKRFLQSKYRMVKNFQHKYIYQIRKFFYINYHILHLYYKYKFINITLTDFKFVKSFFVFEMILAEV